MNQREFTGLTALVTGGSRGIGRACCQRLGQAGANVAINYRSRKQDAEETAHAVETAGGKAYVVAANVADEDEVARMVADVEQTLGPVDLLVNNAGIFEYVSHEQTTPEHWRRTLDVNLTGLYLVTWAVKDRMIERGYGRVVNMSSVSALRARPNSIAYAVSKSGVTAFTKSAGEALAGQGIRMNAIAPGLIDTEIIADVDQTALDKITAVTPLSRMGTPEEIADAVYFLLSDQASFIIGQTLVVDGGRVMLP